LTELPVPLGPNVLAWPPTLVPDDTPLTAVDPAPEVPALAGPAVFGLAVDAEAAGAAPAPLVAPPPAAPPPLPCAKEAVAPATSAMAAIKLIDERVIGQSPLSSSSNRLAGRPFREPIQ
jgi:hypothetical protein